MLELFENQIPVGTMSYDEVESYFVDLLGSPLTSRQWHLLKRRGLHLGGGWYHVTPVEVEAEIAA